MQDQILIVSHPPQSDVDLQLAAPCFGLSPAEVRMKANYGVPEIWVADRDGEEIQKTAQTMQLAGLSLVVLPGQELLLPAQSSVTSFSFGARAFAARVDGEEIELPYTAPLVAVFCQPRRMGGSSGGATHSDGMTDALVSHRGGVFMTRDSLVGFGGLGRRTRDAGGDSGNQVVTPAFLDLYSRLDGQTIRLSIIETETDFTGLGPLAAAPGADKMTVLADACVKRFTAGHVDRRLVDMIPRQRPMVGTKTKFDVVRKGYSFATAALSQLLGNIAPGLESMSQFELASRLAYLTCKYYRDAQSRAA